MSVSTTTNRVSTAGDGTNKVFSFPYLFLANGDLKVILRVDSTGAETVQTITTEYTVTGAESANGGFVTMVTAPASGETLVIYNDPDETQTVNLVENDPLPAETLERALDRITLISQRQANRLDRSVTLSEGFNDSFDLTLPALLTADSVFGVNSSGNGFQMGPTFLEISNADTNASAAATSASEASTQATNASTAATNASTAETNSSQSETDASTAETNASTAETNASTQATNASTAATNASTAETNASTQATNASTQATNASTQATNASTAATNASTAETNASTSETNASTSETAAAASAANALGNDVQHKTNADSPITIADADNGEVFLIDCTSGNVTVNLPTIAAVTLNAAGAGWKVRIKKVDSSANTITVNRGGTDTLEGDTSKTILTEDAWIDFIAEDSQSPDEWSFFEGGPSSSATYQKSRYEDFDGYGSTNTKIPYFASETSTSGSGLFTTANNSTSGLSHTLTEDCLVAIKFSYYSSAATVHGGVTRNSAQLTTNYTSTTMGDRLGADSKRGSSSLGWGHTTIVVRGESGDVFRPHDDGTNASTSTEDEDWFYEFEAWKI